MSSKRNNRIDSLKYWLIVLVIAGHVFERAAAYDDICAVLLRWIYIFHMPLFVFISGYLSRKKDGKDFWKSSWKIIEPLIIFQLLGCGYDFIIKGHDITLERLFTPWYILWYLFSLFCWRLILRLIPDKILDNTKFFISATIIISALSGFLPFEYKLSIQRTLAFLPFFFIGYYFRENNLFLPEKYKRIYFLVLLLSFIIPAISSNCFGDLFRASEYYGIGALCKRMFTFVLSIPISIAFMNLVPVLKWTVNQGKYTLQYYIYHAFILLTLVEFYVPKSLLAAILYIAIIVVVLGTSSHYSIFRKLTNPISSFFKK